MVTRTKGQLKMLSGNGAAAWAVKFCKPDVIAVYPITPQTSLIEELNIFRANGEIDAEVVDVEGENSAMAVVVGASEVGARVFTASSSYGLFYMYDIFTRAAGQRFPIVMVNANREPPIFGGLSRGRLDMLMMRDTGWIQIECQDCQEIFDSVIAAYRLAEDPEIFLPVLVSYDGWYISYLMERVEVATQEDVDKFLAPVAGVERIKIIPGYPGKPPVGGAPRPGAGEFRVKHGLAMERAKSKFEEIAKEFEAIFGRPLAGQIDEYRTDDAEIVLVAMGSEAMTARVVIDKKRDEGMKVGLVRVKMFRPCPSERLAEVLKGKKAIGVLEQGIAKGWNRGFLMMDLKAVLYDARINIPMLDFIAGLLGEDVTLDQIEQALDITYQASQGEPYREVTWLTMPYLYE